MSNLPSQKPVRQLALDDDDFDWRGLYMAIMEKLWLVIVLAVIGGALGFAYLQKTPPVFEARATLEVEDKHTITQFEDVVSDEKGKSSETMNTFVATIQSRTFIESVVRNEKFNEQKNLFLNSSSHQLPTIEQTVSFLASGVIKGTVRTGTRLINITVRHHDAQIAQNIANGVAKGLIRFGLEQKAVSIGVANDVLNSQVVRLETEVTAAEMALQKYRNENNAVSLEQDQNLVVSQMKDLSTKLSTATSERVQLETDASTIQSMANRPEDTFKLNSVANNATIVALTETIGKKKSDLAVMSNRYKPKHPKYMALAAELNSLQTQVRNTLPEIAQQLQSAYEAAKVNEEKFKTALAEQEKKALELSALSVPYNTLKRDIDSKKAILETMRSRHSQVDITSGIEQSTLRIHEEAALPGFPVWPVKSKVLTSSIGGACMLAFGLIYLLTLLDRTIKTVDQAEKKLGLPVMSAVSLGKNSKKEGDALQVWKEPHGSIAESFRSLRVMAALLGREDERRTFLITSAVPSEGKTYCASNYASSLAQQGLKTLLIDADLRKPSISKLFYNETRKPGLAECLLGRVSLAEAAHDTDLPDLKVMPAGERAPNPAELLAGKGMKALLDEALKTYDRIVIDSAPVIAVSDTLMIAPLVETVFQVIRWNKTPLPVIQRAVDMLRNTGKPPSGLILNQLPIKTGSHYYYYSYGHYGNEGVYGAPATSK